MKFSFHLKRLSVLKSIEMIKCEKKDRDRDRGFQPLRGICRMAECRVNKWGLLASSCWLLGKLIRLRHSHRVVWPAFHAVG